MVVPDTSPDRHGHPHFPNAAELATKSTVLSRLRKLDRMAHDRDTAGWSFALNELRNLSPLILPLAEALEGLMGKYPEGAGPEAAEAVLRQLEEAVG